MSTFPDPFTQLGDDPIDSAQYAGGYDGYYPPPSEPFEPVMESPDDVLESPTAIYVDGEGSGQEFGGSDGPILPPSAEMGPGEGFALREWRRENAIRLEEKERRERELLTQIIDEADRFKVEFYRKREIACENNKFGVREKEKLFVSNLEKFHAEADKDYWKSIAELIPKEVQHIERKKGKKDEDKKPTIVFIKGPKPGKPTDLTRMRQMLLKLKNEAPPHLNLSPPAATKDAKSDITSVPAVTPVTAATEAVPGA